MGIRFHCPNGHRLNVKAFLAGKRGICPKCGARFMIPLESETNHTAPTAAWTPPANLTIPVLPSSGDTVADPIAAAPDAVWYVRAAAGGEYGPATGEVMRSWLDEGRVTSDSWVWRDGWPDWRQAAALFPQFMAATRPPVAPPVIIPPPPAVAPQPAAAQWADVVPVDATTNEFTITDEWTEDSAAESDMQPVDPLTMTSRRHTAARENFRRNMLVMTAVLIASALILLGVAVYLVVVRQPAAPQATPEKPAPASASLNGRHGNS